MGQESTMAIEVFIVPGCSDCAPARVLAQQVAAEYGLAYAETNFLLNPQRFLEVGVEIAPAIALNGEVIFRGLPSKKKLRQSVTARLQEHRS